MSEERETVEMIRIERAEQVFLREDIFGRDASSVFPTEAAATQGMDTEATKAALGALNFITESELEELKATRGQRVEDGTIAPDKPLVQVLEEAKLAKEEAFQAVWKSMKTGKNRPLDEDELDFVNAVEAQRRREEAATRDEELREVDAFQEAVRQAAEARSAAADAAAGGPTTTGSAAVAKPQEPPRKPQPVRKLPFAIKPVPRIKQGDTRQSNAAASSSLLEGGAVRPALESADEPAVKKIRVGSPTSEEENAGLAGLLGDYGSDTDDG